MSVEALSGRTKLKTQTLGAGYWFLRDFDNFYNILQLFLSFIVTKFPLIVSPCFSLHWMRCVFATGFNLSSALDPALKAVHRRHVLKTSSPIGWSGSLITISKLGQSWALSLAHACSPRRKECEENIYSYAFQKKSNIYGRASRRPPPLARRPLCFWHTTWNNSPTTAFTCYIIRIFFILCTGVG